MSLTPEQIETRLRELTAELQDLLEVGILAVQLPDSDSNLYLWWGSRTFCLGLTSRLAHGINCELEEMEEGEDESGPIDSGPDSALDGLTQEFPQHGMYL